MKLAEWKKCKFTPAALADGYTIYSLVNIDNGKRYIGRTRSIRKRLQNHCYGIKSHSHKNKAILKDCGCRFEFEILEENVPYRQRTERERFWILHFKSNDSRYGYNTKDPMFADHSNRKLKQQKGE